MAQQTAVEWLIQQIGPFLEINKELGIQIIEQAKAMEKGQMHKCASFWRGKENEIEKPMFDLYYNETYNR
jgi:hypothetical protein